MEGCKGGLICEYVVYPVEELKECGSLCGVVGKARLGGGGMPREWGECLVGGGGEGWGFVMGWS